MSDPNVITGDHPHEPTSIPQPPSPVTLPTDVHVQGSYNEYCCSPLSADTAHQLKSVNTKDTKKTIVNVEVQGGKLGETVPRKKTAPTPEEYFVILASLVGVGLLGVILLIFAEGLRQPVHLFLPLYIFGYRVFYYFCPHYWVNEHYYMSHLHLGLVLIFGLIFMPITSLHSEALCADSIAARHIDMNSIAYFVVDTLMLIDTFWVTHHSLSIACALFGIAGTTQVTGGAVYVWYAELGGLLYHVSRMWPESKLVREIFLVF